MGPIGNRRDVEAGPIISVFAARKKTYQNSSAKLEANPYRSLHSLSAFPIHDRGIGDQLWLFLRQGLARERRQ